jgi:hypothetical protein
MTNRELEELGSWAEAMSMKAFQVSMLIKLENNKSAIADAALLGIQSKAEMIQANAEAIYRFCVSKLEEGTMV